MEKEYQQTIEQLNQLEEIINLDPTNQEIISLYNDLKHLKELQEASLLEEKKKKLLNIVDSVTNTFNNSNSSSFFSEVYSNENSFSSSQSTIKTTETDSNNTIETSNEIFNKYLLTEENLKEGLKCCIPLENEGHIFFLPGMINEINNKNSTCKVLLITPINENLIPCQKLNCNLNCNRSHGIEINKNLIFSYNILDITSLIERGICFAKYEDSIWYKGYDEYEEITPENIIPVCGMNIEKINDDWSDSEENYSTDSNSSSYYSDNSIDFDDFSSNTSYTDTLKILNDNNNSSFGEWEKHTKGIASHLMKKMGYEQGKGLGLNGEGIVNPIEIVIQPPGKGLDFEVDEIEELTLIKKKEQEKRKINLIKKKQRKRKLNSMESIDSDVFDFLNVSINKKAKGKQYSIENKSKIKDNIYTNNEDINKTDTHKQKKLESSSRKNKKENNLKLLQIQKQIYDLNHQIQRAKERYDRNKIRDKVVAEHYKNKIEEFKKILYTLELKEKQIKNSISDSKTLYSKFEF